MSCPNQSQMWLNIPAEEETNKEVYKGGTNPMLGPSPEVSLHAFIVENLEISERTVDT